MSFGETSVNLLVLMFLSGWVIGLVATFLGVGGGILLVPFLIFLFPKQGVHPSCSIHLAIGTSLLVIFLRAIPAGLSYHRRNLVIGQAVLPLAVASIGGILVGTTVADLLPGEILKKLFALLLFLAALRMFLSKPPQAGESSPRMGLWALSVVGSIAGFFSALLGIGGGLVSIPLMSYFLMFPAEKLAGTSSATIIFTSLAGVLGYVFIGQDVAQLPTYSLGYVHWAAAIPLALGGIIAAPLGVYLNHKLDVSIFKKSFAVVLVIVGVQMLFL